MCYWFCATAPIHVETGFFSTGTCFNSYFLWFRLSLPRLITHRLNAWLLVVRPARELIRWHNGNTISCSSMHIWCAQVRKFSLLFFAIVNLMKCARALFFTTFAIAQVLQFRTFYPGLVFYVKIGWIFNNILLSLSIIIN